MEGVIDVPNLKSQFLNKDKTLNKELIKDSVHPTAKGFEVWADAIEPMIQKLLKDAKPDVKPTTSCADWNENCGGRICRRAEY